jgi:hypothetical protein
VAHHWLQPRHCTSAENLLDGIRLRLQTLPTITRVAAGGAILDPALAAVSIVFGDLALIKTLHKDDYDYIRGKQ